MPMTPDITTVNIGCSLYFIRAIRVTANTNKDPMLMTFKGFENNLLINSLVISVFNNAVLATKIEADKISPATTGLIP